MSLYDSLRERLDGRPYRNYFSCYCIFDQHKTPALLVFDDGLAKCLSCNKVWTHKQIDKKIGAHFIPKQRNDTVSRVLPQWRKWEEKYDDLEGIVYEAHRALKRHPQFQTYFRKRKIYEYVDEGNLGYLDNWILFPVYNGRRDLVDIVVRSISRNRDTRYVVRPRMDDCRPLYCPSWEKVNQSEVVYVVYGIIDSISLYLAGLPSITGTTGKSLNAELLRPLRKRFVIVPDQDEEKEAHKLANQLGWRARVKQLNYDECKDPDELRRKFGNDYLLQALGA